MDTWRAEDVVLFPHSAKVEAQLVVTFSTEGNDETFDIVIEGDHLPEGADSYADYFIGAMDLNKDEAQALYDELGRWLNEHGST